MGDTPSGVVARRVWPSRVDRLRVVDPRPNLHRRYCGQKLHSSAAAPRSPIVGLGRRGRSEVVVAGRAKVLFISFVDVLVIMQLEF